MNYKESNEILDLIRSAKKILINCHVHPDPDSVGSALAMHAVLKGLSIESEVVSTTELPPQVNFLEPKKVIEIKTSGINLEPYDLLIALDSAEWDRVLGDIPKPDNIKIINIDHHISNPKYGDVNLVDGDSTSNSEVLFKLFEDWEVKIDKEAGTFLMTGIVGDTGAFRHQRVGKETLNIASKLLSLGVEKDEIIANVLGTVSFDVIKMWGEILKAMEIEEEGFVWAAIPYKSYKNLGKPTTAKETAATNFAAVVKGTDFGLVMVETAPKKLTISMRSRTGVDVSKLASELGGGGHMYASGAKVEGLEFEEVVEKVVETAKNYARKYQKEDK